MNICNIHKCGLKGTDLKGIFICSMLGNLKSSVIIYDLYITNVVSRHCSKDKNTLNHCSWKNQTFLSNSLTNTVGLTGSALKSLYSFSSSEAILDACGLCCF